MNEKVKETENMRQEMITESNQLMDCVLLDWAQGLCRQLEVLTRETTLSIQSLNNMKASVTNILNTPKPAPVNTTWRQYTEELDKKMIENNLKRPPSVAIPNIFKKDKEKDRTETYSPGTGAKNNPNIKKFTPPPTPQVKCLYDYQAQLPNELSFNAGDIIKVIKIANKDWWDGELNGKTGIFPSNYVETINDTPKSTAKPVNEIARRNTINEKSKVEDGPPGRPDAEKPKIIPRNLFSVKSKEKANLITSNPGLIRNTKPNHLAVNVDPMASAPKVKSAGDESNGSNGATTTATSEKNPQINPERQKIVPVTVKANDLILGEYEECHTEDGDLFYYSVKTGCSVWELPEQPNQ